MLTVRFPKVIVSWPNQATWDIVAFPWKRYGEPPRVRSYGSNPGRKFGLAWNPDAAHCEVPLSVLEEIGWPLGPRRGRYTGIGDAERKGFA